MGIFKSLKNAFGFSDVDIEQEINDDDSGRDATVTPLRLRQQTDNQTGAASGAKVPAETAAAAPAIPSAAPESIFLAVVKIFNESMPQFIRESVDEEAQCRYIHQALDDSMKEYIANLESTVELRSRLAWANERERLTRELASMEEKSRRIEEMSGELKEQKLSAERQKRALAERLHDLESKIAALEAEKEQFDLENKSLVNKLRLVSTQEGGDTEGLRLALDEAEKRNAALLSDIEALKKRCEISDGMINELNRKASSAHFTNSDVEDRDSRIAELEERLRNASQEMISKEEALQASNNALTETQEQLNTANDELIQAHESIKLFEESLTKFENFKENKNAQITKLRDEIESLKSTIDNNLRAQAESESALRAEIARHSDTETSLRAEIDKLKQASEEAKSSSRRRHKPEATSITDDLDDTNWLVSSPPEGTNARPFGVSDEEFGYQEPKRRPTHDNPDQMLLF